MKRRMLFASLVILVILLSGCGKKGVPAGPVDESRPISEIKAEAELMTVPQLREMADKYLAAIKAKNPELDAMMQKLRDSSTSGSLSKDFMQIKGDIDVITGSLTALQERFEVYYSKLVELKADVSGLE